MKVLLTATVQSHICQFHKPLAQVLHSHGCEVHVAARNNLEEKNGLKLDFAEKVFDIPFQRSPISAKNIGAYFQLKRIIKENDYDVIHCNTPVGGVLTRIAARKARKKGTEIIYTSHGFHFYEGAPRKNWLIFYPIEKFFAKRTDILITINEEDYRIAKEKFPCRAEHIHGVGVDEERYTVATPQEKAQLREKLSLPPDAVILLCVGELLPNKNQAMAIRATAQIAKDYPNVKLLLAGNGPEEDNLRQLAESLNIGGNVEFLGYCVDLQDYQRASDISLSCSRREGLGLNIIEAMLSGNPVVAVKNRGHNELIADGVSGYLVEQDNAQEMAQKVIGIISDSKRYEAFSAAGCEKALQYGYKVVKEELNGIYFNG